MGRQRSLGNADLEVGMLWLQNLVEKPFEFALAVGAERPLDIRQRGTAGVDQGQQPLHS